MYFREPNFILSTLHDHVRHCAEIETDEEASTRYRVKHKSLLSRLEYFNICSGALKPDVMHA